MATDSDDVLELIELLESIARSATFYSDSIMVTDAARRAARAIREARADKEAVKAVLTEVGMIAETGRYETGAVARADLTQIALKIEKLVIAMAGRGEEK